MKLHKGVNDPFVVAFIHGEARAVPVATRPQLFQLFKDDSTVLVRPVPRMAKELVPRQVRLFDALVPQAPHHLGLRRDGRMVRSWHPTRILPLHPGTSDEDVLDGVVEHVSHVQHPRHVGGRNHHRVGLTLVRRGVKVTRFEPVGIPFVFCQRRIVLRWNVHVELVLEMVSGNKNTRIQTRKATPQDGFA